jgi:hypothetical protein
LSGRKTNLDHRPALHHTKPPQPRRLPAAPRPATSPLVSSSPKPPLFSVCLPHCL